MCCPETLENDRLAIKCIHSAVPYCCSISGYCEASTVYREVSLKFKVNNSFFLLSDSGWVKHQINKHISESKKKTKKRIDPYQNATPQDRQQSL